MAASTPALELGMHIYAVIGRSQRNVSTMGAKLNLDPKAQADTVLHQVLIHLLLTVKLSGPWIKIHADLVQNWELFPFFSSMAFPLSIPSMPYLLPFIIVKEIR